MKSLSNLSCVLAESVAIGLLLACSSQQPSGGDGDGRSETGGATSSSGRSGGATSAGGGPASGGTRANDSSGQVGGNSQSKSAGGNSGSGTSSGANTSANTGGGTASSTSIAASGASTSSVVTGGALGVGGTGSASTSNASGGTGRGGNSSGSGGNQTGRAGSPASGAGGATTGPNAGGTTGVAGATNPCTGTDCTASSVVTYPDLPGAVKSTLYTVTVNGKALFVERLTKYSPEMQIHYAHASLSGSAAATVAVTVNESFNSYTVSPKSRKLSTTKSGSTITFQTTPNYLIVQVDTKELLFILLDAEETNPPHLGDANVKSIADYSVDSTGASLVTTKVQSAIDAASGATQNILYFPPGKYKVGELWLKSNMTLYLAGGAILYGSGTTGDFNTGSGGINIEGCSHGMIRMYKIDNAKILGRGVIDGNGLAIRAQNDTKINLLKIEQSTNILVDGIIARDSSFWDTLVYRSDLVTIQNFKMLNCRPTTKEYNNTDGVDFDESTNGKLYNALLYTGDDSMATKNEEASGTVNTKNILHEHVVAYSNSVGCKIGTKSMGQTMDGVKFKDIDVVRAGRALTIEAYDTAVVQNTTFEDIRVEAANSMLINIALDQPPDWRDAANTSIIKDTYFTNVSSDVKQVISLHGKSSTYNISGVHFKGLTVQGKDVTSQTDSDAKWDINSYVSGITFE